MGRTWHEDTVELLVLTIKKYDPIWNTNHPKYTKNKRLRHTWWKEVTKLFNDSHKEKNFTQIEVLNKWNALRLQFQKERAKIVDLGYDTSNWRYYEILKFLTTHPIQKRDSSCKVSKSYSLRKSVKNENDVETDIVSIGSISLRNYSDEMKSEYQNVSGFEMHHGRIQAHGWEAQKSFGNYIAVEVMHLEPDLQLKAKKIIFDVLMDLQCEQHQRKRGSKFV